MLKKTGFRIFRWSLNARDMITDWFTKRGTIIRACLHVCDVANHVHAFLCYQPVVPVDIACTVQLYIERSHEA
jgi:hypothetical protein